MMKAGQFETLTRVGFAARGLLYMLIGYLAIRLHSTPGSGGALDYLHGQTGKLLLAAMALGFVFYGLWRLSEAAVDTQGYGRDAKGLAKRAAGALSGVIHLGLASYAARLALGAKRSGGSRDEAERGAEAALSLPGGEALLLFAAAILLVAGLSQMIKAAKASFLRHLDPAIAGRDWVRWSGRLGYGARGLVFVTMAWFLWKAATSESAGQAAGSGAALGALPGSLQTTVAAGLLLFGLFSLVEARYRRINDPGVLDRLQRAAGGIHH